LYTQTSLKNIVTGLCDGAKEIVENCRSKEPSVMTVSKLTEKMQCAMCKVGLASFRGNPIQKCIKQNAGSCSAVNACFSSDDKDSTSSSSALKRRALMRRDANEDSIRMWFWVSMIILAIPAFASVIGIPFYIIAVYIASKHMSLNTN
jgi:hypothetical protein